MKNSFFEKCHLSTFATTCFNWFLNFEQNELRPSKNLLL